jgi:hypothetical protein
MPLAVLVNELRIPTVGARHLSTKEARGGALAKVLGSTAWIGVPRVVLAAVSDSSDPAIVHVQPIKGNRVPRGENGRRFRLEGRTLSGFTESVVCAIEDGVSDVDVDAELAGAKSESGSDRARDLLIETLRKADEPLESDVLDAAVANEAGLKARTVRDLRMELNNRGWLRSIPEKDETGAATRWFVALTNAAPQSPALPRSRLGRGGTDSYDSGLSKPNPESPESYAPPARGFWRQFSGLERHLPWLLDENGRCTRHPDEPKTWCLECKASAWS